jgi:hypothetical protein
MTGARLSKLPYKGAFQAVMAPGDDKIPVPPGFPQGQF